MKDMDRIASYPIFENKAKASLTQGSTLMDMVFATISFLVVVVMMLVFKVSGVNMLWILPVIAGAIALNITFPGTHYAHLYHEIWSWLVGLYIRVVLKDVLFVADPAPEDEDWRQWFRDRKFILNRNQRPVLPLAIDFVEAQDLRAGVLNQTDSNQGHLFVAADGSEYVGLDPQIQEVAHRNLAAALNMFVGLSTMPVGVGELRVTRLADLTKAGAILHQSGDPFMTAPGAFDLSEKELSWVQWRQENFDQIMEVARDFGAAENWMVFVVTFQWRDEWKRAQSGKISEKQIFELPLIELGRSLVEKLESIPELGIQNPHIMSPAELAHFVKSAFDPVGLEDYYLRRAVGEVPVNDDDIVTVAEDGTLDMRHVWPSYIEVKGDHIRINDSWFMVVREVEIAPVQRTDGAQRAHTIMPPGTFDSFATVSQKSSGTIEARKLLAQETLSQSMASALRQNEIVEHPGARRKRAQRQDYLEQVTVNSINHRYHRLRVLTADTSEGLSSQYRVLRASLNSQGIKPEKVTGRARLLDALISGVLGANRL